MAQVDLLLSVSCRSTSTAATTVLRLGQHVTAIRTVKGFLVIRAALLQLISVANSQIHACRVDETVQLSCDSILY